MFRSIYLLIFLLISQTNFSQDILFSNDKYVVKKNSVEQGDYKAFAESPVKLRSNFPGISNEGFDRILSFKFAINGEDNERPSGQDHKVYIKPVNGLYTTPVFEFGKPDPDGSSLPQGTDEVLAPDENINVLFRVDIRKVLESFNRLGYYETFNGARIKKENFNGVFIAGGASPLSWDFGSIGLNKAYKMSDDDGDGIYEIKISFVNKSGKKTEDGFAVWELKSDLSKYPSYTSGITLIEALHNLSLEEMKLNIRDDGAFMAGAKWTGVWTRDVSYSIILSLALMEPDACKASLMAKVKNGIIIQDTGTGGSWPCSTDRMVWALASWEVYNVTGDKNWLRKTFDIIKKSAESDLEKIFDPETGLVRGESSFLDWREQSNAGWMDPKDIYSSIALGTNAVHYKTYKILSHMAKLLGKPSNQYEKVADKIRTGINKYLWNEEKSYYNQFLYGRVNFKASSRHEALGSALCVLFDIAENEKGKEVIAGQPVTSFGVPVIYPQIPDIPSYHNNSVWPFVSAYWTWASAKENNSTAVENGLASIYRPASLFLTNKENYVAETGNFRGTEINSDRQLWSLAGNLSTVYRIFMGMNFETSGIVFTPFIPEAYKGKHTVSNFKYRGAMLNITVEGFGNKIAEMKIDGKVSSDNQLSSSVKGKHDIYIKLANNITEGRVNLSPNHFSPRTPVVSFSNNALTWGKIECSYYKVFRNGKLVSCTDKNIYGVIGNDEKLNEYQVLAVDNKGYESFLSEPVQVVNEKSIYKVKLSDSEDSVEVSTQKNLSVQTDFTVNTPGKYVIDFKYANGSGPVNTDNKCAIRTLYVNGKYKAPVIMPHRGRDMWNYWGYSNSIVVDLVKGKNKLKLAYEKYDKNMNGEVNSALIKYIRIIPVNQKR